jgi:hypothetical protein
MFDFEEKISAWRQKMLAAGIKTPATLDELESHLREDYEEHRRLGQSETTAFTMAISQIGQAEILKTEFTRAGETVFERLLKFLCKLAGIPNYQLATNMNTTNSNLEPRWATYAKAGAFVFPATFLWLFTVVFVLPKVNQLCQAAGTTVFDFTCAPAIFRGSGVVGQVMILLTNHGFILGGAAIVAVLLVERYSQQWPRYRRQAIAAGSFC